SLTAVKVPTYQPSASEMQVMTAVLQLTNESRENCAQLALDSRLVSAAYAHTQDMLARDYFGHELAGDPATKLTNRLRRFGYRYRAAGENIAAGQRSAAEVVESWMRSPGHRQNILNCAYEDIGIAVV